MKKILLLVCVCLMASTSAFAQIIQSESRTTQTFYEKPKVLGYPRYQGEVNIGYQTPAASVLETIHGARFNKYLFVGVGIGAHYIGSVDLKKDIYEINVGEEGRIPLFVNAKGYLPIDDKISPYLNLSMGCDIGVDYGSGFYCDFGLGVKYNKFTFALGLLHHGIKENLYNHYYPVEEDMTFAYNAFYLKVGLCW